MAKQISPSLALNERLNEFVRGVATYLMPKIGVLSQDEKFTSLIDRQLANVVDLNQRTQQAVEIFVFDHISPDIEKYLVNNANSIFIFAHTERFEYSQAQLNLLHQRIAVSILHPSPEVIFEYIKLLLFLKETLIHNHDKRPLISVDKSYRSNIKQLIQAITARRHTSIFVDDNVHGDALHSLLFDNIPYSIRPYRLTNKNDPIPNDYAMRYLTTVNPSPAMLRRLAKHNVSLMEMPLTCLFIYTHPASNEMDEYFKHHVSIHFEPLKTRIEDALLFSFWQCLQLTHTSPTPKFVTRADVKKLLVDCDNDMDFVNGLVPIIEKQGNIYQLQDVNELANTYERLNLPSILKQIEFRILQRLKQDPSVSIEKALNATGLKEITFHSKYRRLNNDTSLFSLYE